MPYFQSYLIPNGFLDKHAACHALWYYYVTARNAYETTELDPIVLEGDKDPTTNFQQLFTSIATAYGVTPEAMIRYWANVDMHCDLMKLPRMPMNDKYRFNKVPELRTQ